MPKRKMKTERKAPTESKAKDLDAHRLMREKIKEAEGVKKQMKPKTFRLPAEVDDLLKAKLKTWGISFQDFVSGVIRVFLAEDGVMATDDGKLFRQYVIAVAKTYPALRKDAMENAVKLE